MTFKFILRGINNRIYLFKQYLIKRLEKDNAYKSIPNSQLIVNWLFQRVLRINSDVPFSVNYTTCFQGFKNVIIIGNDETIRKSFAASGGCYFGVADQTTLEIGEGTIWAFNVCIQTSNHGLVNRNEYKKQPIKVGKNCWIGNSVTILPGICLGDNVTVGANSVVTKSFPSNVVIAGCPAKIIKHLTGYE